MLIPILMIAGGVGAIVAAIATGSMEGEPAEPVELPPSMPVTPVVPSASPQADANEVEALARVIASEAGNGTRAEMKAIGWTERNRARAKGKSLYDTFYPWRSQSGSNPPASSARPATDTTRALAKEILTASQSSDPTGGATSFFEPKLQDVLAKAGAMARAGETGDRTIDGVKLSGIERFKNYYKNAAQIREKWGAGSALYAIAGRFEFFGKKSTFLARGGEVKTIVGGAGVLGPAFNDIPDPLALLPKYRKRGVL